MNRKNLKIVLIFAAVVLQGLLVNTAWAESLSESKMQIFSQNDIIFYNPGECVSREGTGGSVSVCGAELSAETIKKIEDAGIKEKAAKNMERYKYAEEQTGLPWQILAALHYREGGMDSGKSISNGDRLYNHVNVDGIRVTSDPNQDALDAANHFINNAKSVYDVDVVNDQSMDALGYGFLAYNRGSMYKCNGNVSYTKSPYVMNFYDDAHMSMTWIAADSKGCHGETLNHVAGKKNSQLGALTVFAYLCGGSSTSGETSTTESGAAEAGASTSSSSGAGGCDFTKYNYSDEDLKRLAAIAASENGDNITSLKNEMSLMANLYESKGGRYSSVLEYVLNSGWFGSGKGSISGSSASSEQLEAARDVFNNGNRTLPSEVDEHDCIDCGSYGYDITKIEVNGKTYTSHGDLKNADNYVKNETKLHNKYGATYTFYTWANPDNPVKSDPMGYTGSSVTCEPGGSGCSGGGGGLKEVEDYPQYRQQTNHTCGPTSMAMLVSYGTGGTVTEEDIIGVVGGDRVYVSGDRVAATKKVCEKYGCEAKQIDSTENAIRAALKDGWMVHYSGRGDGSSFESNPFGSSAGHYVGLFGIDDDDQVVVANSAYQGNKKMSLHDAVKGHKGLATMAIKFANAGGGICEEIDYCETQDDNEGTNISDDILKNVQTLIDLANKNGSKYELGGSGRSIARFDKVLNDGDVNIIDCTGFASEVYYMTYKDEFKQSDIFDSNGIINGNFSSYKEIDRSEVRPGDIFAYAGHGGIVIEAENGVVTKIAETGGKEGRSGSNENIGYSGSDDYSVRKMNTSAGHFFRWKGAD